MTRDEIVQASARFLAEQACRNGRPVSVLDREQLDALLLRAAEEARGEERQRGPAYAAAYVYDRAHQYDHSSGIHAALCEVAHELQRGEGLASLDAGELDDVLDKVPRPKRGPQHKTGTATTRIRARAAKGK